MTESPKIQPLPIDCKGNVKSHYDQVPHSLRTYASLRLISGNDHLIYFTLLSFVHTGYGYAFPTIKQLAKETGLSDRTVKQAIKTLENVGLIVITKAANYGNKNRYHVRLPREKDNLKQLVPHLFAEMEHRNAMHDYEAKQSKERLEDFRQSDPQPQEESQAQQPPGKSHSQLLEEEAERKMFAKMEKLPG